MHDDTQTAAANIARQLLTMFKAKIIRRMTENKDHIAQNIRPYWMFRDDMTVI